MRTLRTVILAALTTLSAISAFADCTGEHSFVVVFDLRAIDVANNEFGEARQRVYSFPVSVDRKLAAEITDHAPWDAISERLVAHGTSARWIGAHGEVVQASAYGSRQQISEVQFKFDEKPRLARLSRDIVDLIRIAAAIGVRADDREETDDAIWRGCHTLKLPRAELTVKAVAAKVPPKAAKEDEKKEPVKATYWPGVFSTTTVTGSREALFLSADVPLTKASQLKPNDAGTDVVLGDEPGAFYVGVNYTPGDILAEPNRFFDRLVLKGMVKADRTPWDSYGWAIGVRSIDIDWLGIHLDTVTPFAGYTYTRQEAPAGQPARGRNSEFRLGVSLNLNSAVKWIKPDAKK